MHRGAIILPYDALHVRKGANLYIVVAQHSTISWVMSLNSSRTKVSYVRSRIFCKSAVVLYVCVGAARITYYIIA